MFAFITIHNLLSDTKIMSTKSLELEPPNHHHMDPARLYQCTLRWTKTLVALTLCSRKRPVPVHLLQARWTQPFHRLLQGKTYFVCVTVPQPLNPGGMEVWGHKTPRIQAVASRPAVRATTWYPVTPEPPLLGELPTLCMTRLAWWTAVKSPLMMTTGWQNQILNFTLHRRILKQVFDA